MEANYDGKYKPVFLLDHSPIHRSQYGNFGNICLWLFVRARAKDALSARSMNVKGVTFREAPFWNVCSMRRFFGPIFYLVFWRYQNEQKRPSNVNCLFFFFKSINCLFKMIQMACPLKARNCPFGCGVKECSHPSQYALKTHAPLLGNVKMETTHFKEASLSVSNTTP